MSSLAQQMREVRALRGGEERAESWLFQQHGGEDGEMDSVQRGMDLFLGLCCVGEQVDLWQTHTILICAQPDNASQGQNSSAQCFLTGCFFNYMSEAIKLRRRFSHKALFYVSVITVNYKATRKETMEGKMQKEKWVYSFPYRLVFVFITLLVHWSFWSLMTRSQRAKTSGHWPGKKIVHLTEHVWIHEASTRHTKGKKNKPVQILSKWIIQE